MNNERIIDAESRQYILERFKTELKDPVTIDVFANRLDAPGMSLDYTNFTLQFIRELAELADGKIIVNEYSTIDKEAKERDVKMSPTVHIGWDKGYLIEYMGAPAGYEASAFIDTIIQVSQDKSGLSKTSELLLKHINRPVTIMCFVTPSCPYCPQQVLLDNRIAIAAKGFVKAVCVEAEENMELSNKWRVRSVPQQVINDDPDSITIGVQPETNFVKQVLEYGTDPETLKKALEEYEKALKEATKLVDNPDHPVVLTDDNFEEALKKYPLLVVDCWAEWCQPCKMIAPIIEEMAQDYQGKIVFGKLDTDNNPLTANKYRIRSIPTLLIFKNGELVDQIVGAMPRAQLEPKIVKHLENSEVV